jgi:predicted amidohydrolase YtcJ
MEMVFTSTGSNRLMLSLALVAASASSLAALPAADTIYLGNIVTVHKLQPEAQAVAVRGGKIVAVVYRDEVMQLKGSKTRLVDLAGKTMLPGFVDPHSHVFNTGIQAVSANLLPRPDGGVNDISELQATLKTWVESNAKITGKYQWIIGFGYDDAQLKEQRHPTREDLDQVSKDAPVVIVHQSGHLGVMNSKALELVKITASSADRQWRRNSPPLG